MPILLEMPDVKTSIAIFESSLDPGKPPTPMVQSNEAVTATVSESSEEENEASRNGNAEAAAEAAYVVKKPHANSKLILQNMEEVLNSVKKQHRQKHRRKKEQRKLAQLVAQQAADAEEDFKRGESSVAGGHQHEKNTKRHSKKPLQEKTAQENGLNHAKGKSKHRERKSPLKSAPPVSSCNSILKHFQHTPRKEAVTTQDANKTSNSNVEVDLEVCEVKLVAKSAKTTNVFEVMMNARNKSIGSNTPGKELPADKPVEENQLAVTDKVKRRLLLQEWAEKKGAAKRKLEEEARAAYVDKQMEHRAKRFKTLLTNGKSSAASNTQTKNSTEKHKENTNQRLSKRAHTRSKKHKRTHRLSSVESLDNTPVEMDADTTEFLSKLSSPTKKCDSLLGYFPRKESPKEVVQFEASSIDSGKTKSEVPVVRARRSTSKRSESTVTSGASVQVENSVITKSRGRPKRTCAGRSHYDNNLQESPTKVTKQPRRCQTPTRARRNSTEHLDIIELEDSNIEHQTECLPPLAAVKLAPLFTRAMPKPSVDPVLLLARKEFLMSGVPERVRLEQAKQKQCEQSYEEAVALFPKTSHVQQLSAEEAQFLYSHKSSTMKLKLHFVTDLHSEDSLATVSGSSRHQKSWKTKARSSIGSMANCTAKDFQAPALVSAKVERLLSLHWPMPTIENKRSIVRNWKMDFERFPTYKCYNQMREKYRYFSAIDSAQDTEQVTESFVMTRRTCRSLEAEKKFDPEAEEEKPPATAPNGELLFTEKYKPLTFEQVLVNLTPVTQLREFLNNWSSGSSSRNSQTLDDSMDSANDSCSSQQQTNCNSVVLLGPISSGKTSAVFALANEMNFNVLEINAGMKRTGKKLIQELQEATQSHQIRKDGAALQGKSRKTLLKMSLNGLKSKKQSSQSLETSDCSTSSLCLSPSSRKSLILIEDADLVFEQLDAGFTDAIYTLAASSKRPVIIVASDPNCMHLQRLMSQNTINFVPPHTLNIARFLSVLSLVENCPVALDDLVSLYLYNGKDTRKTLLELQFFIQTGGDQQMLHEAHKQETATSTAAATGKPTNQQQPYFASPNKRRFSEDPNAPQLDEQLHKDVVAVATSATATAIQVKQSEVKEPTYMHRTLFEFYTVAQNEKWRVPFPINFRLLHINLSELFKVAHALKGTTVVPAAVADTATKRKSRSPKKAWLKIATSSSSRSDKAITPLDALCDFYEHTSVATLLGVRNEARTQPHCTDGLVPHVAGQIAHSLVEHAITVNLAAEVCPYNLFDTAKETHSLCDYLGTQMLRTQNARCLDYEPALRAICRSERRRATLDRRSTRFYHYLRNSTANVCSFSTQQYDAACDVLQEPAVEDETATAATAQM